MIDSSNINSVFDAKVVDQDDDKIGTVKQVFVDDDSGQPLFASVATGLFGMSESFVPLQNASFDGDVLRVGFEKDMVKDAPRIDADDTLTDPQQDQIWDYYFGGMMNDRGDHTRAGRDPRGRHASQDAMTGSEERLNHETVPTGRARLRKHVVTEPQVQREEVRVEREPITDANIDEAISAPDFAEDEREVTLNEERGTQQENVSEDVPHEEIVLDYDDRDRR